MTRRVYVGFVLVGLLAACGDAGVAPRSGQDAGWDTREDLGQDSAPDLDAPDAAQDMDALDLPDALDMPSIDDMAAPDMDEPDVPVAPPEVEEPAPEEPPEEPDPEQPMMSNVGTVNFTTLHWNIAGGKENACRPDLIRRAVMRYVRESNTPVDLITLNETCEAQYEAIREALRGYWKKGPNERFSAFEPSDGSRVGNAFFSRQNVTDITRLEIGTDQYGKRFLLCGLQVNRRVRVCATHLTPADSVARVQLGRVLNRIEQWWDNRQDTVVIGGDFNITPNDQAFNQVYAPGANTPNNPNNSGSYRELDDDDPQHCRGYGERTTRGLEGGPCGTGGKIDFIFVRANRIVNGDYRADSLDIPDDCTGICSDHRALRGVAKIRYRKD